MKKLIWLAGLTLGLFLTLTPCAQDERANRYTLLTNPYLYPAQAPPIAEELLDTDCAELALEFWEKAAERSREASSLAWQDIRRAALIFWELAHKRHADDPVALEEALRELSELVDAVLAYIAEKDDARLALAEERFYELLGPCADLESHHPTEEVREAHRSVHLLRRMGLYGELLGSCSDLEPHGTGVGVSVQYF